MKESYLKIGSNNKLLSINLPSESYYSVKDIYDLFYVNIKITLKNIHFPSLKYVFLLRVVVMSSGSAIFGCVNVNILNIKWSYHSPLAKAGKRLSVNVLREGQNFHDLLEFQQVIFGLFSCHIFYELCEYLP